MIEAQHLTKVGMSAVTTPLALGGLAALAGIARELDDVRIVRGEVG